MVELYYIFHRSVIPLYLSLCLWMIWCSVHLCEDGKGRAIDNVFIERFFRTIKYEKLYLQELCNGHQVEKACSEFIDYYNLRRDHSSLQDKTPFQVYSLAA